MPARDSTLIPSSRGHQRERHQRQIARHMGGTERLGGPGAGTETAQKSSRQHYRNEAANQDSSEFDTLSNDST